jgi:hypothetical protein
MNVSQLYRVKATMCERCAHDASDPDIKLAWTEVAIEWHALAARMASGQIQNAQRQPFHWGHRLMEICRKRMADNRRRLFG